MIDPCSLLKCWWCHIFCEILETSLSMTPQRCCSFDFHSCVQNYSFHITNYTHILFWHQGQTTHLACRANARFSDLGKSGWCISLHSHYLSRMRAGYHCPSQFSRQQLDSSDSQFMRLQGVTDSLLVLSWLLCCGNHFIYCNTHSQRSTDLGHLTFWTLWSAT